MMKQQHIIKILDAADYANLSANELAAISEHVRQCQDCGRALQAARISSVLLKYQNAVEKPEPSPFFQAKVLNAWREKHLMQKPLAAFYRWWQASAALIILMLLTVAGLIALTAFAPRSGAVTVQSSQSNFNLYSTDAVIFNQKPARNLTTEQTLQVLDNTKSDSLKR